MSSSLQYFKPQAANLFVGDCMPFSHNGEFFFYYLLDEGHHQGLGGLGGHQWALATSTDLCSWEHQPLAIPLDADWEGSICTGSVIYHEGRYYAFYATRRRDFTQHLGLALSSDGIHYQKTLPNPFFSPPPGYDPYHFRDPFAFRGEDGVFHLIVTAFLYDHPLGARSGCLAHLVSPDLRAWELRDPFFIPGSADVPECADTFFWKGWYYLIFSSGLTAHYRMAKSQFGPWQHPGQDWLEAPAARVMKTAEWKGRRIGAAWLGERSENRDSGHFLWSGQAVFRELVQFADGRLGVRFVEEMALPSAESYSPLHRVLPPLASTHAASFSRGMITLARSGEMEALCLANIPPEANIRLTFRLGDGNGPFGLRLRAGETFGSGYELLFEPALHKARLFDQEFGGLDLSAEFYDLKIQMKGSILDVCFQRQHCLITRAVEQRGNHLWFFAADRECWIEKMEVSPLL
jgi:beta-fructofuranosidase